MCVHYALPHETCTLHLFRTFCTHVTSSACEGWLRFAETIYGLGVIMIPLLLQVVLQVLLGITLGISKRKVGLGVGLLHTSWRLYFPMHPFVGELSPRTIAQPPEFCGRSFQTRTTVRGLCKVLLDTCHTHIAWLLLKGGENLKKQNPPLPMLWVLLNSMANKEVGDGLHVDRQLFSYHSR